MQWQACRFRKNTLGPGWGGSTWLRGGFDRTSRTPPGYGHELAQNHTSHHCSIIIQIPPGSQFLTDLWSSFYFQALCSLDCSIEPSIYTLVILWLYLLKTHFLLCHVFLISYAAETHLLIHFYAGIELMGRVGGSLTPSSPHSEFVTLPVLVTLQLITCISWPPSSFSQFKHCSYFVMIIIIIILNIYSPMSFHRA